MTPGDFTTLAEDYAKYRPDYSGAVLRALLDYVGARRPGFRAADVGAGTGLWTKMLAEAGLSCVAVEPNHAMRAQGEATTGPGVAWRPGSGECTGLATGSQDWVTMASSFHWVRQPDGLEEFHRVLKPGGYLTALWNPRHIQGDPLHERIERTIYEMIPGLTRVSSGAATHVRDYHRELTATGHFREAIFFEADHRIVMSKERYMGAWRSVNDIQQQAGPERFAEILAAISDLLPDGREITVPYRTRAWTAQRVED